MIGSLDVRSLSLVGVAAAALCAGAASAQDDAASDGGSQTHYRLFVGDHAEGVVRAVEFADGADAGTFPLNATPSLTRSDSGRLVYAVQGEAGTVAAIDSGIALHDHGDHPDLDVEEARLLPAAIRGTRPAHIVEGSGKVALFDDGTGAVSLFEESRLLEGRFEPQVIEAGPPHHGLAAPMGRFLVVSVPDADPEKPRLGLRVLDADGRAVGETVACPAVHGQARSGGVFAFGCRNGIVVATPGAGAEPPSLRHVAAAGLGEGHVSTLKGGQAMRFFLGNFGPGAVVVIEPDADAPFRRIDLPSRRVDFALDPARPTDAYVLTEDGWLHRIDVVSGTIRDSADITEPYSMDGHWRDPRPRLAVAGGHVAVTDPRAGLVRIVSAKTLKEERTIPIEGVPYTIVAVGGSGAVHD